MKTKLKPLVLAILASGLGQVALAQSSVSNIVIQANNDENNGNTGFTGEGVFISSNTGSSTGGAASAQFRTGGGAAIWGSYQALLQSNGSYFSAQGDAASIVGDTVFIQSNASTILGPTSINATGGNATTIGSGLNAVTLQGGTNSIIGTNTVTGATSINTTGTAATSIGNNTANVTLAGSGNAGVLVGNGGAAVTGTLSSTGSTTLGTNAGTTNTIGNAGTSTNTIQGAANNIVGTTNTVTGTTNINTTGNGATTIGAAGNASAVSIYSGASTIQANNGVNSISGSANSMTSTGANTITAATSNTIQAATNSVSATVSNTVAAPSNFITATTENRITGLTNINVSNNAATNINTGTSTSPVSIGNSGMVGSNLVTARSGNTTMSLSNNVASLTAGSTLGSNGTTGTASAANSGGVTVFNTAQPIPELTTVGNVLGGGKQYQNLINGNLFVDGNVYINGTLDYVSRNAANTTVMGATGTSNLSSSAATSGGTAVVMKGTSVTTTQTVVDANGKLSNVAVSAGATAAESTAALTLTNGLGNTHGLVVTESKTTMSGGNNSSSLTLDDNGATFSNASTGRPVRVHGVYDGRDDFDAVNVRQLGAGVAMASALAAMPQVDAGKRFNVTAGVGSYLNANALAIGGSLKKK